jgi:hypothetical protein
MLATSYLQADGCRTSCDHFRRVVAKGVRKKEPGRPQAGSARNDRVCWGGIYVGSKTVRLTKAKRHVPSDGNRNLRSAALGMTPWKRARNGLLQ